MEKLLDLLRGATVSASGLDIIIACDDIDAKDAILDVLLGAGQSETDIEPKGEERNGR